MAEDTPAILYKYLEPARVDVLDYMRIRYTQPSALNDPYECVVGVDVDGIRRLAGEALRKAVPPTLPGVNNVASMVDEVIAGTDLTAIAHLAIKESGLRERLDENVGVLSLSEVADNSRLWSLYSSGHRGFCIGFCRDPVMFGPSEAPNHVKVIAVEYSERPGSIPTPPALGSGPLMSTDDAVRLILQRKSHAWADEREVRVVRNLRAGNPVDVGRDPAGYRIMLFPIDPRSIASIVFGARSTSGLQDQIRRHCREHGISPKFQRVEVPFGSYEIKVVDA